MIINVKVKPNSNKESLEKSEEGYIANVKERAEDNKANIALIKLLAKQFKISSSCVKIKRGLTSRKKVVEICQ